MALASKDTSKYESMKNSSNGQEVEAAKSEKSATKTREYKRDNIKKSGGSPSY